MARKLLIAGGVLLSLIVIAIGAFTLWLRSDAVRTTIESQATAALGMPVRIGSARADVFPRLGFDLLSVEIGSPAKASVSQVTIGTGLGIIFSRRVEDADVQLNGGNIDVSLLGALGALSSPPPASASAAADSTALTVVSVRSIRLRDVTVVAGAERIPTNLDASLAGDTITISSATARFHDATFEIQGKVSNAGGPQADFDVRADTLPVDALLGALGALSGPSGGGTGASPKSTSSGPPLRLTATIAAPVATIGSNRVTSVNTRLATTATGLVFDPLKFGIDDGVFEARAAIDLESGPPVVDVRGNVSGMDVTRFQTPGTTGSKAITGRLGARFTIQGPAQDGFMAMLEAARGSIDLDVRNGRMPGIEVIRQTVLRFANRATPPPSTRATDTYSRLTSTLTLQAGAARITGLTLNAADFDVTGSGTFSIASTRLALAVELTLTEALSALAGRDLYRYAREGKRIVLPATIGGTLSEPTASIDVAKATGRAIRNRVEDEMRSILDRAIRRNRP